MRLGELLNDGLVQDALRELHFDDLDLSQYSLTDIPELDCLALNRYEGWEKTKLSEVLGLEQVPFSEFPSNAQTGFLGFVAVHDVTYGGNQADKESQAHPTKFSISGSDIEGFHVNCVQDQGCDYLELESPISLGIAGDFFGLHGARWIRGGDGNGEQMVRGGYGALGNVNGGREPTGRLPFGDGFKVVLVDTDESTGSGQFGLYFRYCQHFPVDLGCTPYYLGPVPWFGSHEKGLVFVGLTAGGNPTDYGIPGIPDYGGYPGSEPQTDLGGDPGTANPDCLSRIMQAVPPSDRGYAQTIVPMILQEAQRAGVTDRAQIAYILATAQAEVDFNSRDEGWDDFRRSGRAGNYYGRGLVQLTWRSNYQEWTNRLGVDLINHPELANRPDIASRIMVEGMRDGTFTDRRLGQYISGDTHHFVSARWIVNDSDRAHEIAGYAERYLQALNGCSALVDERTVNPNSPAGEVNQRIMAAVRENWGMSTANCPNTNSGRLGCACGVNRMLIQAGLEPVGPGAEGTYSVPTLHQALENGRGTEVSASQAQAGDIIIIYGPDGRRHTGFCANAGCTQAVSNSSSNAAFVWRSDGYFSPSYGPRSRRYIYRLNP